jgi:hypothetical protein
MLATTLNTMMMIMMLHQLRHGRQDNHATNRAHAKRSNANKAPDIVKPDIAHHIAPKCVHNIAFLTLYRSQTKHPGKGYGGSATARHERKGTRMRTDKKG